MSSASNDESYKGLGKFIPYFRNPENVLRAKLDSFLLSWMFIAGIMKEMDQSATTQAYVSGMREDLQLWGNELNWFQTYFSIAYALCLVPSQLAQTKLRPSLWLPSAEIAWGLLTLFTYRARSATTVYVLRFFLGALAATSWPGITSLIMTWYTPRELALRLAIFNVSDVAGAMFLGVVQSELYVHMNSVRGLAGWQWLFIVSGAVTILLGLLGYLVIPDAPGHTRAVWLSAREKQLAGERLQAAGTTGARIVPWRVLRSKCARLLRDPLTYLFIAAFAFNAWSARANAYILLYLQGVTDAAGRALYTTQQVNLLPLGGYAIQMVTNIGINALGDWKGWRWPIFVASGLVQLAACSILSGWPGSHAVIMFAYALTYTTSAGGPALIAWLTELLRAEPEARSIIVGMSVTVVYVGHATIPLGAWRVVESPRYPIGFPLSIGLVAAAISVVLTMRFWLLGRTPDIQRVGYGDSGGTSASTVEEEDSNGPKTCSQIDRKDAVDAV